MQSMIIAEYLGGATVRVIGERHGVTRETVHHIVRRAGVPRERTPGGKDQEFTPAELDRIAQLRRSGSTIEDLMRDLGMGRDRVVRALDQMGLPLRLRRKMPHRQVSGGYLEEFVLKDDPMRAMARKNGHVLQHRLVMARAMGRPLRAGETVHHVNGDVTDNRLDNLQLRVGNHGKGVAMRCLDCGSSNIDHVTLAS